MLLIGTRGKELKTVARYRACPQCGHQQSEVKIFVHFLHVWYIPVWVYRREVTSRCPSCLRRVELGELKQRLKHEQNLAAMQEYEELRLLAKQARFPFYLYIGLLIILSVVVAGSVGFVFEKQQAHAFMNHPTTDRLFVFTEEIEGDACHIVGWLSQINEEYAVIHADTNGYTYDLDVKDRLNEVYHAFQQQGKKGLEQELSFEAQLSLQQFGDLKITSLKKLKE